MRALKIIHGPRIMPSLMTRCSLQFDFWTGTIALMPVCLQFLCYRKTVEKSVGSTGLLVVLFFYTDFRQPGFIVMTKIIMMSPRLHLAAPGGRLRQRSCVIETG